MRELMIALIVASTLISVAEAFYKMATPANANFEAHDAVIDGLHIAAPQHEDISVGASTATLTQRSGRPRYSMLRSCGIMRHGRGIQYVEHVRVTGTDLFDLDQKKKERSSCNRVIQVPRCGIGCQIAKRCAVFDTHDDNSEAN